MFDATDPRTYALPLVRTIEALTTVTTVPLTDADSHDALRRVEDTIADHLGHEPETIANLDYDAARDHYDDLTSQPFYRQCLPDDGPWVVFQARHHAYDQPHTVDHALTFDAIYTADGTLLVDAYYATPNAGHHLYRGAATTFSLTDAFHAGLTAIDTHSTGMIRDGSTPTEVLDFLHTDLFGRPMESWADDRDTGYEAVRSTREAARDTLRDAGWPADLTAKPTESIGDPYRTILDAHEPLITEVAQTITLPDADADANAETDRAILTAAIIEAYAILDDTNDDATDIADSPPPTVDGVLNALRNFTAMPTTHAWRARAMTATGDYTGIDPDEFSNRADTLFHHLKTEYDADTPLPNLR